MSAFHPEASANFNRKAEELFQGLLVDVKPSEEVNQTGFFPDVPISGHLTDDDIQGKITQYQLDSDGREIGRLMAAPEGAVRLEGEPHGEFRKLAHNMHRVPFMRDSVSLASLTGWLGEWLLERHLGHEVPGASDYVAARRADAVKELECMVPLCEPFIESPFDVGVTRLRSLTRAELEEWFRLPDDTPDQHVEAGRQRLFELRKELQARTAVVVEIEAEPDHAGDVAWNRANLVSSMLRLFSKGIFYPQAGSNCVPLGLAVYPKREILTRHEEGFVGIEKRLLDPESMGRWSMSNKMIHQDLPYLNALAKLYDVEAPSDFQRDLLRSVLLYSRAALTREVPEKLVHIFAALESLLLRSESEPVQSAISERIAFVSGSSAANRATIARTVKLVYALRSRFVHHGRSPDKQEDLDAVKDLQRTVWTFFFQAVTAQDQYGSRDEFLDDIERRKWQ